MRVLRGTEGQDEVATESSGDDLSGFLIEAKIREYITACQNDAKIFSKTPESSP
jgi:hypothetical protein